MKYVTCSYRGKVGNWVPWVEVTTSTLDLQVTLFKFEIMQANNINHFTSKKFVVTWPGYIETNEA